MSKTTKLRNAIILLIEDNNADTDLITESIGASKLGSKIVHVSDAVQGLDYLYKQGDYIDAITPDLILLDLSLPKMDGHEFLEKIKNNPAFSSIPLVVLTTSNDKEDINHSYGNLANCFITKPVDLSRFIEVIQAIEYFWLKIAKIPGF
jgi:chemotaxis family two-component system response regulator Rcp1